jgi:hypothetical protein
LPLYKIDPHQPAHHESEKEKSPLFIPSVASYLTNEYRFSARHALIPNNHLQIEDLDELVQSGSIMVVVCTNTLVPQGFSNTCPNSMNYVLQGQL